MRRADDRAAPRTRTSFLCAREAHTQHTRTTTKNLALSWRLPRARCCTERAAYLRGTAHSLAPLGTLDMDATTTFNAALHVAQFWDGRSPDVEDQAKGPVLNPIEMAMPSAEWPSDHVSLCCDLAWRI